MAKKLRMDWSLFAIAASLALFGAVMVYSASAMISLKETSGNAEGPTQFQYFFKQFTFTVVGLIGMWIVSRVDYKLYRNKSVIAAALIVTALLLISVFFFPAINGAKRWIRLPGMSFQPSEIAKIALPIFFAWFLTEREKTVGELKTTVLPCLAVLGFFGGLVVLEPDLGTAIVLCAIFTTVYFAAGARIVHLASVAAILVTIGVGMLVFAPFRVRRLIAFLDPCSAENAANAGYQVCQSLLAIGSGGVLGEGFAKGQQKLFYLPYPYSDFIFAVVGEELGLVGTLGVVIAFAVLLWRGTRAALMAPDRFGRLLGIGLITGLTVQALFNISVVISMLPAKGIPLPFISYGGSSIIFTLIAVGILLNISQYAGFVSVDRTETAKRKRK
ncbi:MAG: putative lipid II flippase FtsW [Acidobacteria bacterium]|nr:putative lipid II flippase FtsW [Acidobacteriota bacterium]